MWSSSAGVFTVDMLIKAKVSEVVQKTVLFFSFNSSLKRGGMRKWRNIRQKNLRKCQPAFHPSDSHPVVNVSRVQQAFLFIQELYFTLDEKNIIILIVVLHVVFDA